MITIGMDVHVRNSYLHVTDDAGEVLRRGRCHNTMMDLAEFLGPIERESRQRGEAIHAVLESTTNSRAMQRLLTQYGEAAGIDLTADVLDARKIRIIAESVCKCDRLDAKVLRLGAPSFASQNNASLATRGNGRRKGWGTDRIPEKGTSFGTPSSVESFPHPSPTAKDGAPA